MQDNGGCSPLAAGMLVPDDPCVVGRSDTNKIYRFINSYRGVTVLQ